MEEQRGDSAEVYLGDKADLFRHLQGYLRCEFPGLTKVELRDGWNFLLLEGCEEDVIEATAEVQMILNEWQEVSVPLSAELKKLIAQDDIKQRINRIGAVLAFEKTEDGAALIIIGTKRQRKAVKRVLFNRPRTRKAVQRIDVAGVAGWVIGKNGSRINDLRDQTGADMFVHNEVLIIKGTEEQVEAAEEVVMQLLSQLAAMEEKKVRAQQEKAQLSQSASGDGKSRGRRRKARSQRQSSVPQQPQPKQQQPQHTQPTQPAQQVKQTPPPQQAQPYQPRQLMQAQPSQPTQQVTQSQQPHHPQLPQQPQQAQPSQPRQQVQAQPSQPTQPAQPRQQVQQALPSQPAQPVKQSQQPQQPQQVTSTQPAQPRQQVQHAQPSPQAQPPQPPKAEAVWEWQDEHGRWHEYCSVVSTLAEAAYRAQRRKSQAYAVGDWTYVIKITDEGMWQQNLCTKTKRPVQRRVKKSIPRSSSVSLSLPPHWPPLSDKVDPLEATRVRLHPSEAMYQKVLKNFQRAGEAAQYDIISIDLVQCVTRWKAYCFRKTLYKEANGGHVDERYLWHGTARESIDKIAVQGFLRQFGTRQAFGDGVYFAVDAGYSINDAYSAPDSNGYKRMFLARVLTGEYHEGYQGLKIPHNKPHNRHAQYESVVDDEESPSMFVLFTDDQAYPEYIVTFKEKAIPSFPSRTSSSSTRVPSSTTSTPSTTTTPYTSFAPARTASWTRVPSTTTTYTTTTPTTTRTTYPTSTAPSLGASSSARPSSTPSASATPSSTSSSSSATSSSSSSFFGRNRDFRSSTSTSSSATPSSSTYAFTSSSARPSSTPSASATPSSTSSSSPAAPSSSASSSSSVPPPKSEGGCVIS